MSMLLEDLADETTASLRRAADRMAEEARELEAGSADPAALRARAAASARAATGYAVARLPEAEAVWDAAVARLGGLPAADAVALLRGIVGVFEGGRRLCGLPRDLWARAVALGAAPDPLDELDRVSFRFLTLARRAAKAADHREHGWQPADPERYARGLQDAREGRTVTADEARRWFRAD